MDRRTRSLLLMAAGCAALFVLVLAAAYVWDPARSLDLTGLTGFVSADDGWRETLATWLVQLGDPAPVALMALGLAGLAAARGRPRVAVAVLLLVILTSASSQWLKELLAHPREQAPGLDFRLGPEAFPSGHATAAMSLALAAVLAAPRRARPAAAMLGALLALAVGASVVAGGWHFPSDVLGGYLLATGWALVLAALLSEADRRHPATGRWADTAVRRVLERNPLRLDPVVEVGRGALRMGARHRPAAEVRLEGRLGDGAAVHADRRVVDQRAGHRQRAPVGREHDRHLDLLPRELIQVHLPVLPATRVAGGRVPRTGGALRGAIVVLVAWAVRDERLASRPFRIPRRGDTPVLPRGGIGYALFAGEPHRANIGGPPAPTPAPGGRG